VSNGNATKCKGHQISEVHEATSLLCGAAEITVVNVSGCPPGHFVLSQDKLQLMPDRLFWEWREVRPPAAEKPPY
jgi:hypothetical protein